MAGAADTGVGQGTKRTVAPIAKPRRVGAVNVAVR